MNNNSLFFKCKICSYGFLNEKNGSILYLKNKKRLLILEEPRSNVIEGYLIFIEDITGLNYNIEIYKESQILIETKKKYYFKCDIEGNINIVTTLKNKYIHIKTELENTVKYFGIKETGILYNNEKLQIYAKEGLPYWCNWICFLENNLRVIIQLIFIFTEICILIWTMYQISKTLPEMIIFINKLKNIIEINLKSNYIYLYFESNILYICNLFNILIQIIYNITIYPIYILLNYFLIVPINSTMIYLDTNLRILFQLKVISLLNINYYISYLVKIFNIIYNIVYNFYIFVKKLVLLVMPVFQKGKYIKDNAINKISIMNNIKNNIVILWQYIGRPINYCYNLIKAPHIGEIGRKIKVKILK